MVRANDMRDGKPVTPDPASTASADPLPKPKTSRGEATRDRILDAAEEEIGGRGFSEASITSITARANVGQGTFYLYFRTKEDVLRELVLRMGRRLRRHLTLATRDAPNRLEVERRAVLAFFVFVRQNPNLYRVVAESQFVDDAVFRRYYLDLAEGYRAGLKEAAARGEISEGDAEVRAWALMGIGDMVGRRYALWDPTAPLEIVADAAFQFIARGLETRAVP